MRQESCYECHRFLFFLQALGLTSSIYTTMAISIDRYIFICMPFCSKAEKVAPCLMASVMGFSLLWSTYQALNSDGMGNMNSAFGVILLLLTRLIPLVVMSILSLLVIRRVQKSQRFQAAMNFDQKKDMGVTKMLLIIIAVFVVCHTANFITLCYFSAQKAGLFEESHFLRIFSVYFGAISNILLALNSSYNLTLYVGKDKQFRRCLLPIVTVGQMKPNNWDR